MKSFYIVNFLNICTAVKKVYSNLFCIIFSSQVERRLPTLQGLSDFT